MLELDDIQSGVLFPRPTPYAATYLLFRIDNRKAGRELMGRTARVVASAAHPISPAGDAWFSVALTFQGLKALGVPAESLESFPPEFQQGMAARATVIGDTGENSPDHWEKPLGGPDVHVLFAALAPDRARLDAVLERARTRLRGTRRCRHDLAPGLLRFAVRKRGFRFPRRYQPSRHRRERSAGHEPEGAAAESGRVHSGLPR